jgi:membrane protein DedA with SNARE-associated domain
MTDHAGRPAGASEPTPRGGAPNLPWTGQAQRADRAILGLIAFSGIYYLATSFLVGPWVGRHPVWLALIRGSATAVITLGALARTGHSTLTVAVLAGLPGTILFDWVFWWAGRRWGDNAVHLMFRKGRNADRRIVRVKRLAHRYGWLAVLTGYIIPIPVQLIAVAVGLGGMSLPAYVLLDAAGALIWLGLLAGLGYWIGQSAVDVADAVSSYSLRITLGLVAVILVRQFWSARRRTGAAAGPPRRGR